MAATPKWEAAQVLRAEVERLRRDRLTNAFDASLGCLQVQALRAERGEEYQKESFPCWHFEPDAWEQVGGGSGLRKSRLCSLRHPLPWRELDLAH